MQNFLIVFLGLLLFLGTSCGVQSHYSIVIAELEEDRIQLVAPEGAVLEKIDRFVSQNSELEPAYTGLEIVHSGELYRLIAFDENNRLTTAITLIEDGGKLYERNDHGGYAITCSGCLSAGDESEENCTPQQEGLDQPAYCSDCSRGDCTKTVTKSDHGVIGN